MNISQLQSFVALADTGSFTAAAETVYLSQSAVSHSLAALERELGVLLLERNRKGVIALTDAGQRILPYARELLKQISAIAQEAKAAQGHYTGKLHLGSIQSFVAPQRFASLLTSFQQQYPQIEVSLFEGAIHEIGEWLSQSVIDVSFVVLPTPDLDSHPIFDDELVVVLPAQHPLQSYESLSLNELLPEGLVIERGRCTLRLMEQIGVLPNKYKPTIRHQAHDMSTILAMVRAGLGITLMPGSMLPDPLNGLIVRPLSPALPLQIGLGVKSWQHASRNTRLFIEHAQQWAQRLVLEVV